MKITDIQAFLLSSPMPEPISLPFYGGVRTIYKRDALFVKMTTDAGITGYGPGAASEPVAETINSTLRDLLIGEDPTRPEAIQQKVDALGSSVAVAFGAINVALYDIRGKADGCPVHELLGGQVQDRIRLYGSAGMYQSAEEYAAEAKTVVDQKGFTAYKYRPALGPEEDLRTVHLMREAVGPDVGLCLDAHGWFRMGDRSYTPDLVEQMALDISDLGITWLEEPLPPEDRDAYSELRKKNIVPIAAGEHETSHEGFMKLIEGGCVDVLQADVPHHGGLDSVKAIIAACQKHDIEFAFHNWGTELETIADAHVGAVFSRKTAAWLEYPWYAHRGQPVMYPFPLADEILTEPLNIENGDLIMPDTPGLGVEINEGVIAKYPYIKGPWSIFELDSPRQTMHLSGDHALVWDSGK